MSALVGTILGVGAGLVIAIFGGAWVLSGRVSKAEQLVEDLPKVLNGTVVRSHEGRCANYASVRADPTNPKVLV